MNLVRVRTSELSKAFPARNVQHRLTAVQSLVRNEHDFLLIVCGLDVARFGRRQEGPSVEARLALSECSGRGGIDSCLANGFEAHDLAWVGRLHLLAELGECVQVDAEQVINRRLLEEIQNRVLPVPRNAVGRIVELPPPVPLATADKIALESRCACILAADAGDKTGRNLSDLSLTTRRCHNTHASPLFAQTSLKATSSLSWLAASSGPNPRWVKKLVRLFLASADWTTFVRSGRAHIQHRSLRSK